MSSTYTYYSYFSEINSENLICALICLFFNPKILRMAILFRVITVTLLSSFLWSCSQLRTSDYVAPQYKTPEDYIKKNSFSQLPSKQVSDSVSVSDEITLSFPVEGIYKINRGFKQHKKRRNRHLGMDFGGTKGTPILAAHEGQVIYAGRAFKGYGKMVILENNQGYATFYAHLNEILVKEGENLRRGERLGRMGRTGRATGVHLHFELRISALPVDPYPYIDKNGLDRLPSQDSK